MRYRVLAVLVILAFCSSAIADIRAGFDAGNTSAEVDGYPGAAGRGWAEPWTDHGPSVTVLDTTPVNNGGNYLSVSVPGGTRQITLGRKMDRPNAAIDLTASHVVSFDVRIDDISAYALAGYAGTGASAIRFTNADGTNPNHASHTWWVAAFNRPSGSIHRGAWHVRTFTGGSVSAVSTGITPIEGVTYTFSFYVYPALSQYRFVLTDSLGNRWDSDDPTHYGARLNFRGGEPLIRAGDYLAFDMQKPEDATAGAFSYSLDNIRLRALGASGHFAERPEMMILPIEGVVPDTHRVIWSTEPGVRYELQESVDLTAPDGWFTVAGYPSEAAALAQQEVVELHDEEARFYRVIRLDDHPPVVVQKTPRPGAFGVGRFSSITMDLDDVTGVNPASISMTVGDHGTFTLADDELSYEDGTLVFDLGGDAALGGWGAVVEVSLTVADLLGNGETFLWTFNLEMETIPDAEVFVFGSPDAQRAGQRLTDRQKAVANRVLGNRSMPMADPQRPFTLEEVAEHSILISYEGDPPPAFNVDQLLANMAPVRDHEIIYRRVTGVHVFPATQTVLLDTVDVSIWETLEQARKLLNPITAIPAIFEIAEDGLLVDAGGTLVIDHLYNQTLEFSGQGGEVTFGLDGRVAFSPEIEASFNIQNSELQDLYIRAAATLVAEADFIASITGELSESYRPETPFLRTSYTQVLGMLGPIPIWAEIRFSLNAEVGVSVDMATELTYNFYYERHRSFSATYSPRDPSLNTWKTENISAFGAQNPHPVLLSEISGGVWAELIPQIDVRILHLAGAKAALPAGVRLDANASFSGLELEAYDWSITAYIDLRGDLSIIGVGNDIFPYSYRFFERQWGDSSSPELTFVAHPQSQSVMVGDALVLSSLATGPSNINYQWYQDGLPVHSTGSILTRNSAHTGMAGQYHVRASGGGQTAYSEEATVTVTQGPPQSTAIYYLSDKSGTANIYRGFLSEDSIINEIQVTFHSSDGAVIAYDVCPVSGRIAYVKSQGGNRGDLYLLNSLDGMPTLVPNQPSARIGAMVKWAPDGTRLLFSLGSEQHYHHLIIATIRPDGSDYSVIISSTTPLNRNCHKNTVLWIDDGMYIGVTPQWAAHSTDHDLWFRNNNGSFSRITNTSSIGESHVVISPNGSYLAYQTLDNSYRYGIRMRPVAGGAESVIIPHTTAHFCYPNAWMDSQTILYTGRPRTQGSLLDLYLINIDGSNVRNISNSPGANVRDAIIMAPR